MIPPLSDLRLMCDDFPPKQGSDMVIVGFDQRSSCLHQTCVSQELSLKSSIKENIQTLKVNLESKYFWFDFSCFHPQYAIEKESRYSI